MRILFISNWAASNGLSRSTVQPHLQQLATYEVVEKIVYISIESAPCTRYSESSGKVEHAPIVSWSQPVGLVSRIIELIRVRSAVLGEVERLEPDIVICRGAPAGALGYIIWKKFAIPYYVESFEPHAEYMAESGVWSQYGIKYLVQRACEDRIKRTATGLITVSEGYATWLVENENISPDRLGTVPCWVDKEQFKFSQKSRELIRAELGLGESLVCIYVGQFGGLYYDSAAFRALRIIRDAIGCPFHVLLLTPSDQENIGKAMAGQGFLASEYSLRYVDHMLIPAYLSAADFGVSFFRSTPVAAYSSPIKYGEYWGCGLPIIASNGVGDEAGSIDGEGLGCTTDFLNENSINQAAKRVIELIKDPRSRENIRLKGTSKRSKEKLIAVYDKLVRNYISGESSAP